jgi:Zn-dependent protease with chaperone function
MRAASPVLALFVIFLSSFFDLSAQNTPYIPRQTYSSANMGIYKTITKLLDDEVDAMGHNASGMVHVQNEARKKYFKTLLIERRLIQDKELQDFVAGIVKKIEMANHLPAKSRYVLLVKDATVNAHCVGNGVFLINIGLLQKLKTEDELAFVLAHEIAHDELRHMTQKMMWLAKNNFQHLQKERIIRMLNGKLNMEDLYQFRNLNEFFFNLNREKEFEADSLGLQFFTSAGYRQASSLDLLQKLDENSKPNYPLVPEAFLTLHSEKYPFQEHWLDPRLKVYSKKLENSFLFNLDSLSSHPAIPLRKKTLESYFERDANVEGPPKSLVDSTIRIAEFETVESAFVSREYERCMLQSLTLFQKYPENSYLTARISGVLLQLLVAKPDNMMQLFVRETTAGYSDELRLINNFLYNISTKETGEIAFHFLSNPKNFDPDNKDHYYILWKLCELTYRHDVQNEIAKKYRDRFNRAIYTHDYKLYEMRKLNIFDFYGQWGWVFL